MSTVVALKPIPGCDVRLTTADAIDLILELEGHGWECRTASGQFIVNSHGQTIPKLLSDRIRAEKKGLVRLVDYCEKVP